MTALLFWNCTDYAGDWENDYGPVFAAADSIASSDSNGEDPNPVDPYAVNPAYPVYNPAYPDVGAFTPPGMTSPSGEDVSSGVSSSAYMSANSANSQGEDKLTLWDGNNPDAYITGYGYSYWWAYDDGSDGGRSSISWLSGSLEGSIYECFGICGTACFNSGTALNDPFVGVGYDVDADASSWDGVCVAYMSQVPIKLEMGLGDGMDESIAYNNPMVTLDESESRIVSCFKWSDFEQQWSGETAISGEEASKSLSALKFKIQGSSGTAAFAIYTIVFSNVSNEMYSNVSNGM